MGSHSKHLDKLSRYPPYFQHQCEWNLYDVDPPLNDASST
uniref:Uncharacterized protein n=1 Tax=Rhizophora mucronata TaxID=61149 RepID=A0A2P2IK45_RHIMU